eukprot:COSAG02_NODE_38701_length_426_cov_0.629969_1_plen_97_part_10
MAAWRVGHAQMEAASADQACLQRARSAPERRVRLPTRAISPEVSPLSSPERPRLEPCVYTQSGSSRELQTARRTSRRRHGGAASDSSASEEYDALDL